MNTFASMKFLKTAGWVAITCLALTACTSGNRVAIDKEQLQNKIKGGWAGQTIGVCYGGPTEFRYQSVTIPDSVVLDMADDQIKRFFNNDDIYMDLTFVEVFERLGLDAPVDSFAVAFANAGYSLWHANQAARYNILHGIMPPASGHWLNNPHADDIDYQIEADFAGLMAPGMPNAASEISDRIGHIMNYGDGWYGGIYVGAMYALAFVSDDIPFVVTEALKTVPEQSRFYRTIYSVIEDWRLYPNDWKKTWTNCEERWGFDIGCPDGALAAFNIDASINAAYIVIGLLYGNGDFEKTLEISTRCGQDSDCNPASAGGILGTILGYDRLPEMWIEKLKEVEDIQLSHTHTSLSKAYRLSYEHALEMIKRNGGKIGEKKVTIVCQQPVPVRYEKSFEGIVPVGRQSVNQDIVDLKDISFEGVGIVIRGQLQSSDKSYAAKVEVSVNGQSVEIVELPAAFHSRRHDIFWTYQLPEGKHSVTLNWLNPHPESNVRLWDAVIYRKETTN